MLESDYRVKINRALWEAPACFTIGWAEQSVLDQEVRADQQRIARKRGQARVRRVATPGGPQRQGLPPPLAGIVEPVHPLKGGRPQVSNAVRRRQRGHMHQHTGGTAAGPEWRKRDLMFEEGAVHDTGQGCTFQISVAYWAMVRSLENFPEPATFKIALPAQALGSPYKSTRR